MNTTRSAYSQFLSGPCPCDGCPVKPRCAQQLVACEDFAAYVFDNRIRQTARSPTERVFQRIYKGAA